MLASVEKIRIFSWNILQVQIFQLSLYFVYRGFRIFPKNAVAACAATKRYIPFLRLRVSSAHFFNHTKTMRLMPTCKQIPDFLANSRTCVFLQNAEKCIESFFYFYNDKLFSHKLIHAFSFFRLFQRKALVPDFQF